jgi:hypothetical protein
MSYGSDILLELPALDLRNKSDGGMGPLGNQYRRRMFYKGDNKEELIDILQNMLVELEYDLGPAGIDGRFGDVTEKAVKQFQKKNKDWKGNQLKEDGLVGPKTSDALNRAMVGKWNEHYQTPKELVNDKLCLTVTTKFLIEEGLSIEPDKAKEARVVLVPSLQSGSEEYNEPVEDAVPLSRILVGINYPWNKYGWDFGHPPPGWNKSNWQSDVEIDIKNLKILGIFAMRWFIFSDGMIYGINNDAPKFFNGRWHFDPPKICRPTKEKSQPKYFETLPECKLREKSDYYQILKDFEWVLKCLKKYDIKLIPSLIDFHWCLPGVDHIKNNKIPPGYVKGGRSDVIIDRSRRDTFFEYVLIPFLEISKEYKDMIFAWELINEPEWITKGDPNGKEENKIVSMESMKAFIREGIGRINSEGFKSTVGFANFESIERWGSPELGITLHQFHYYPKYKPAYKDKCGIDLDGGKLQEHKFHPDHPCFIGEFAMNQNESPNDCFFHWPELKTDQSIYARLKLIENKKYPFAFLWSMNANDKASIWPQQTQFPPVQGTPQYDIWRYTSGK